MQPFSEISFTGQRVTIQRSTSSRTGYVAVGWDKGLPVACQPISLERINDLLRRYPSHYICEEEQ